MTQPLSPSDIHALYAPHPFRAERIQHSCAAGQTVSAIAAAMGVEAYPGLHAFIDGQHVAQENWPRVRPKAGTVLTFRATPLGGGGSKNPLRTVLSLALMVASPYIAAGVAGSIGAAAGSLAGKLITFGVNLAGKLALNALAPPAKPRFPAQKESQTLFIQGAQNRAQPFGRIPKVLGKHRFVPPYGAYPYTETAGSDQYLRLLFVWGYGPLHITDLKIGETPLSEFDDVEVETRYGYPDDAPLTLYSNSVLQNDLAVEVKQEDGYIVRTTEADADEIGVDITLPRGLVKFGGSGGRLSASVRIEIQYSPAGENDWSAGKDAYKAFDARSLNIGAKPQPRKKRGATLEVIRIDRVVMDAASGRLSVVKGAEFCPAEDEGSVETPALPPNKIALATVSRSSAETALAVADARDMTMVGVNIETESDFAVSDGGGTTVDIAAGGLQFPGVEITGKQTAALRETVTFQVPKGRYDVRVRRMTEDAEESDKIFDETTWTALRTIRYVYPVRMAGLAMTAMRIKATGQLNGVIERFNGVVTSILPDWTGEEWTPQATSNPAALFRHVLQGSANARPLPDSRLDLSRIEAWHDRCSAANREFNMVVDYDISVREMLGNIAASGRAAPALQDGKWSVVEDMVQDIPVQHFTPRNTFAFEGRKSFDDLPEALRIRFINREKGWQQDERVVYDDGYDETNTVKFETLELPGVTDPDQAWKDGRYHIATARLRPETYSFSCDIEHIVCTRGDLVRLSHDVPLFGLMAARVKSVTETSVTLDAAITMESGRNYAIRFRRSDGSSLVTALQSSTGTSKTATFAMPVAEEDAPQPGDLALFGEAGTESAEMIVKSIRPQNNLTARITCVDAAPAVHAAETGTLPLFTSLVGAPQALQRPPAPVLAEIQSGEEALIRNTDGSLSTRIVMTLQPPSFNERLTAVAQIRAQDETRFRQAEITAEGATRLSIGDVEEGEIYDIEIKYVSARGAHSPPLLVSGHRVEGTAALPSDVQYLSINALGDTSHLAWDRVTDLDLSHYTLRFSPQLADATWSSAVDIVSRIPRDATAMTVPTASGSYLLKAVDVGGRVSVNAAVAVLDAAGAGQNAVLDVAESPDFTGVKTYCGVSEGALQLSGNDLFDDWEDVDAVLNVDVGNGGLAAAGLYEFANTVDLGAVYTSRLTATLSVSGLDLNAGIDSWESIDAVENFEQDVDPSLWSVQLQVRTTQDDPEDSPEWGAWTGFIVGDYTARAFEFRVLMASSVANITPVLSGLTVDIDMPDRLCSQRDITAGAAGSAVLFDRAFRDTPAIAVTPRNLATGDYYAVTAQTSSGFTIRFFDSGGTGVARHFDYLARGYGEKQ